MRIDCALLCDAATVREGLLYVLGGGLTRAARTEWPAPLGMYLALRIMVHPTEADAPHEVKILLLGEDGERVGEISVSVGVPAPESREALEPGEELVLPLVLNLQGAGLPKPGAYSVEVLIDGAHQRSSPVLFKEGATQ